MAGSNSLVSEHPDVTDARSSSVFGRVCPSPMCHRMDHPIDRRMDHRMDHQMDHRMDHRMVPVPTRARDLVREQVYLSLDAAFQEVRGLVSVIKAALLF